VVRIKVSESAADGSASPFVKAALTMMDPGKLLVGLDWVFCDRVVWLLLYLAWRGFGRVRVISGCRTLDEQRKLYGKGRSAEECAVAGVSTSFAQAQLSRVTWCIPEVSMHVRGRAIDVDLAEYGSELAGALQDGCRRFGLAWGGDWRVVDAGHVELG
jgi:peptidoglycan L-alanyl-D-glutamate endopeptidase CwlK